MAGRGKKRELTREQILRLHELEAEESAKPIEWFRHDSNAHDDPAVGDLFMEPDGHRLYGLYWLLVERLAARDGHRYEVKTERNWLLLVRDLYLNPHSEDDLALVKRFVKILADLRLVDHDLFEAGVIASERLWRNCNEVGHGRASKRLAGEITAQQRWGDRDKERGEG